MRVDSAGIVWLTKAEILSLVAATSGKPVSPDQLPVHGFAGSTEASRAWLAERGVAVPEEGEDVR